MPRFFILKFQPFFYLDHYPLPHLLISRPQTSFILLPFFCPTPTFQNFNPSLFLSPSSTRLHPLKTLNSYFSCHLPLLFPYLKTLIPHFFHPLHPFVTSIYVLFKDPKKKCSPQLIIYFHKHDV